MPRSSCTISLFKNDLSPTRLTKGKCPVKNCSSSLLEVPFQKWLIPFCPEHGIRIHKSSGFVYYNGPLKPEQIQATRRNINFHTDYYVSNFIEKANKLESHRLCYESSEDAVSYNIFTELLSKPPALKKLISHITGRQIHDDVKLYLWGGEINLEKNTFTHYKPLLDVRKALEPGRTGVPKPPTEPDIMLVIPKKLVVCIEAKFSSKNPLAEDETKLKKRKRTSRELIEDYCHKNKIIDTCKIFDFNNTPSHFYEQLFRNIVFAASMAKLEGAAEWRVVNLRNKHVMNLKQGRPESAPVMRNIRSILTPKHKKHFSHLTWEEIYNIAIKDDPALANLTWYMKNKSLKCSRAFNVL